MSACHNARSNTINSSLNVSVSEPKTEKTMADLYQDTNALVEELQSLCGKDDYTLVLHKHLGDIFYAIASKDIFEQVYKKPLHFIVRPQHEFLMKLFGVTRYKVFNLDAFVKKNHSLLSQQFPGQKPNALEFDRFENEFFISLFPCFPTKGSPFICENLTVNFLRYPHYWCFRWAANMGIKERFHFSIPRGNIELSNNAKAFCESVGGIQNIVLVAPEAATATELPPEMWNVITEEIHKAGYTVLVNSKKYKFRHGLCAFDYDLSLEDIVAIGLKCAYVFSLRSGLCDVLVGIGSRLYTISPAMLRREDNSLSFPFNENSNCNEVQLYDWKVSEFTWRGIDFQSKLQKVVNKLWWDYIKVCIKRTFSSNPGHRFWQHLFENIFGKGRVFPENNLDNPILPKKEFKIGSFALYKSANINEKNNVIRIRSFLGGLIKSEKGPIYQKFKLCGIPIVSTKNQKNRVTRILGIPVRSRDRFKEFCKYLQSRIQPGHDHIYVIRHNIGETFVYLSYIKAWIEANKSKNPLVIVWRLRDIPLYRLFLGKTIPMQFIPISQTDINCFFKKDYSEIGDMQFFTPSYCIADQMRIAYQSNSKTNFKDTIVSSMGLPVDIETTNKPQTNEYVKESVSKYLNGWQISKPFVLLCPEATSLSPLPLAFWNDLCKKLHELGYYIIVNSVYENNRMQAEVTCNLPLDELFELSTRSKGIISMASGLGCLLCSAGIPISLLYTAFKHQKSGYTSSVCLDIYSVMHLNLSTSDSIREFDVDKEGLANTLSLVLSYYDEKGK